MRALILAGSVSLLAAMATFACSSASPATNSPDAGSPGTSSSSSSGDDGTGSSSSSSSSSGGTTDPGDAGDTSDADAGTTTTSGGVLTQDSDAGALCDQDAFGEQEPNDTAPGNALPVTGTGTFKFCGTATAGNPDFVSFTVPQFHNIQVQYAGVGPQDVSGTVGNQQWQGNDLPQQINQGDVWTTEIQTGNANGRAYQITFLIQ